ncbi:MAG: hypothetical protein AB2653_19155 [Candidatus Thiodiazotropha endolucinida]|nr:hypothetical protein [Candidatus Thiodiazotropha endolucinida]
MNIIKPLIISLFLIPMTACAAEMMPVKSDVFYNIDKEGNVIAVDSRGKEITLKRVDIPFKHDITEIKSIENLTIIELEGSHFRLICTSSRFCYYQPLPH